MHIPLKTTQDKKKMCGEKRGYAARHFPPKHWIGLAKAGFPDSG
jgi:hypothetical protein